MPSTWVENMGSGEQQETRSKETCLTQTITDSFSVVQVITNFPQELRAILQWMFWRGEGRIDQSTGEEKVSKPPIDPKTLRKADKTDPRTWGTFEDCCAGIECALEGWKEEDSDAYRGGGLGFVFTEQDPYTGIDLDECRDRATGEIEPWARQLIAVLHSYTEISPSGTGVHIYVKGHLAGTGQNKKPVELYDRKAYFTVTGDHLRGTPTTIEERRTAVGWLDVAVPLMKRLLTDKREKFQRLFAGDISGYNSPSEADLGLCSLAAHVSADAEQIDALMRLSGLVRPKWDEMHGAQTYGQMTIAKAREGKGDTSGSQRSAQVADVVCLATVQPVAVDWLWRPYLPLGKLCSLEGDPGTGKSTLTATLAAYVTTGLPFPGEEDTNREPRNVLFLQCEDDLADTFLPRLVAADADVSRVYAFPGLVRLDDTGVEQSMAKHQSALVVIDPIQGYIERVAKLL